MKPHSVIALLLGVVCIEAIIIVLLGLLPLWGLRPWGGAYQPQVAGSWADMVGAFATAGALLAGFATLLYQWWHNGRERDERRDSDATQVYVWLKPRRLEDRGGRYVRAWFLQFKNNAGHPIFSWTVKFWEPQDDAKPMLEALTGTDEGPILPGETEYRIEPLNDADPAEVPRCSIEFEDGLGRRWRRTTKGKMEALKD